MMQLRRHPDLPQEPLPPQHLRQTGVEHFQRHIAVMLEVMGEINDRHAAVADLAPDGIAAVEGGRELVLQIWQSGYPEGSPTTNTTLGGAQPDAALHSTLSLPPPSRRVPGSSWRSPPTSSCAASGHGRFDERGNTSASASR